MPERTCSRFLKSLRGDNEAELKIGFWALIRNKTMLFSLDCPVIAEWTFPVRFRTCVFGFGRDCNHQLIVWFTQFWNRRLAIHFSPSNDTCKAFVITCSLVSLASLLEIRGRSCENTRKVHGSYAKGPKLRTRIDRTMYAEVCGNQMKFVDSLWKKSSTRLAIVRGGSGNPKFESAKQAFASRGVQFRP